MDSSNSMLMLFTGLLAGIILSGTAFVFVYGGTNETADTRSLSLPSDAAPLERDVYESRIPIVAVSQASNEGLVNMAQVEIQPGRGRVLVALNPFIEPDTQQSAEIAAQVAAALTKTDLSEFDLIYSIDSLATLVGGPSAGAALTLATIAAIKQSAIRTDVAITGTVLPDGSIGPVGGILEKAQAVAADGQTLFLIPSGQSRMIYYEPQVIREQRGPFAVERRIFVPKELDLVAYAKEELNLEIREVVTVSEAAQVMLFERT